MTKKTRLRICNYSLLVSMLLVSATAIAMLVVGGLRETLAQLHAAFGLVAAALVYWHIRLHFGKDKWGDKIKRLKSHVTRRLFLVAALAFLSAVIVAVSILVGLDNPVLGHIHGLVGVIFLLFSLGHALKRKSFFTKKKPAPDRQNRLNP